MCLSCEATVLRIVYVFGAEKKTNLKLVADVKSTLWEKEVELTQI